MESQWFFDLLFFNLIFYFDEKSLWHTFSNDKRNFSGFLLKLFYLEMHWKKDFWKIGYFDKSGFESSIEEKISLPEIWLVFEKISL